MLEAARVILSGVLLAAEPKNYPRISFPFSLKKNLPVRKLQRMNNDNL